jgi:hypothetical protein
VVDPEGEYINPGEKSAFFVWKNQKLSTGKICKRLTALLMKAASSALDEKPVPAPGTNVVWRWPLSELDIWLYCHIPWNTCELWVEAKPGLLNV